MDFTQESQESANALKSPKSPNAIGNKQARETLNTASTYGTVSGSAWRAICVERVKFGTKIVARICLETPYRTVWNSSPFFQLVVNPPKTAGATLSGCPSIAAASSKIACLLRFPLCAKAQAAATPETIALAEDPIPRACGMRLCASRVKRKCGKPNASHALRNARTTRCVSSFGNVSSPSP
ncbi:Uncharacterised protein [Chlamydia trachomatis]|nr:Uncharacterised protein [Chlamydia trachomatis]